MSTRLPKVSLLDAGKLPVAQLARIAMREGVRPRAAYQAHKWFARRLAITARALLVGAAAEQSESFWSCFYKGDSWTGRTVLDPFVGGGVMLLEAVRLGASVQGVDIEPVAATIAKFQTELRDLPDLQETLTKLSTRVGGILEPFYKSRGKAGNDETLLHAFWVQRVRCKCCSHEYDAHPSFRFAWDDASSKQWVTCGACSRVIEAKGNAQSVTCSCGNKTPTSGAHLDKGEAACPACGSTEPLIELARRTGRRPSFRLFAVEVLPSDESRRYGLAERIIRSATKFDEECYRRAKLALAKLLRTHPHALPVSRIPRRCRSDTRLTSYGYDDYRQLFNARQLLHLALLGREIGKLKGPLRRAMAVAFSDHLTTNNMMCAYAGGWRRLTPLFSIRAYRHIPRPVEINPWLRSNGRGTFPNAVRSVVRASEALKDPVEPTPVGLVRRVEDSEPAKRTIKCGDARRLRHIASSSIDMVLTDPPYFDYISYSELGHFFAPWLARFGFIPRQQIKSFPLGQLAPTDRSADAEKRFAARLASAFREIRRVCRQDGRVVFTYQNLNGRGWSAIAKALARSGVVPMSTFPLYGDSSASLHKQEHSISWDCVMVCEIREPVLTFSVGTEARLEGVRIASAWAAALKKKALHLTTGDQANIAHAAGIVSEFARRRACAERGRVARTSA